MPTPEAIATIFFCACALVGCSSAAEKPTVPEAEATSARAPSDELSDATAIGPGPFATNGDPSTQIRFRDAAAAEERRARLVRYVWSGGLPDAIPDVTPVTSMPSGADDIELEDVERVDLLYATIAGSPLHSRSFLFHPSATNHNTDRVVIVHQGHAGTLEAGVGRTAGQLLRRGFTVLAMAMPLYGWNGYDTEFAGSHNAMFAGIDPADGSIFRPFLEPVIQNVNFVRQTMPSASDITMIGLSGGGWTTAVVAAIDPRISLSIQVAGSAPLYVWDAERWPTGDREQFYAPLLGEDIRPDGSGGGVATYLELYALAGWGAGRRAIQVTNENDPCCFRGRFADSYRAIVEEAVAALGEGSWSHVLDSTHSEHQISDDVIENVIEPALGIDEDD